MDSKNKPSENKVTQKPLFKVKATNYYKLFSTQVQSSCSSLWKTINQSIVTEHSGPLRYIKVISQSFANPQIWK